MAESLKRPVKVVNLSRSRLLVTEVLYEIDRFVRTFPDLYVINIGAVDAPPREIPLWYSDMLFKRFGRTFYLLSCWFHKAILVRFRPQLVRLRGSRSWVSKKRFAAAMKEVIETLQQETGARIVVLGINGGNGRVETSLPGACQRYREYSGELRKLCGQVEANFVDLSNLSSETFFPDGVHYNEAGHHFVASLILTNNEFIADNGDSRDGHREGVRV